MQVGDILHLMFNLPEQFATPDILYTEELSKRHPELPGLGLSILPLSEITIELSIKLKQHYPYPSQNDLFALALAMQEQWPLLTGDRKLREAAKQEEVEVKGTIWLVGRLLDEKIINVEGAEKAYQFMSEEKRRLPWDVVKRQLTKYRK